jgi:predicted phage tail protein
MTSKRKRIEVRLLGKLGQLFGRKYVFYARNPREIISALSNQLDGFTEYLARAHENNMGFRLVTDNAEGIPYEELTMPCERLVMAPIIVGSGNNIGQILAGVALIALSFVSFGAAGTAFAGVGTALQAGQAAAWGSQILFSLGASLLLTGIAGLLTPPVQNPSTDSKKKDSFLFDRAVELTTQGYPVPLLYGQFLATAPLVISSAISTETIPV